MSNVAYADFSNKNHTRSSRMDNSKLGHVAIFRSLLNASWAEDTVKLALWVRLLGQARHKPTTVEFGGVSWDLRTGQLVTKAKVLARKLKDAKGKEKTEKQIRDMLDFFEQEGMITRTGTRHGTIITITNYLEYQWNDEVTKQVTKEVTIKRSDTNASSGVEVTNLVTKEVKQNKNVLEQEINTPLTPQEGDCEKLISTNRKNNIPYIEIMNAFNEAAGDRLPNAESLNDKRKRAISKFLKELKEPTVEAAKNYFEYFMNSAKEFYFGENDSGWRANFDYLLRPATVLKTREGSL